MLKDHFYQISSIETVAPHHYDVAVILVLPHPVYNGHFPENPVVPGVCSLQIITECAGQILGYPVCLLQASVVKFLGIIRPLTDSLLRIDMLIDGIDQISVKATMTSGERTVMSCKLKLGTPESLSIEQNI